MEQLEDRTVPSSFTAASVSDLIADIKAANKQGGSNTIALSAPATSPYVLTGAYGINKDGATGLPTIALNDNLSIAGNGDTIERSTIAGTPAFRLFDVASGGSLTLQNLTLQGGWAFGSGVSAEGGAIYSQGALALNGVTVQNNIAQGSDGTPTLKGGGKTNAAGDGAAAAGGAIYSGSGTLTLVGATVQGNQALGGNGGTPKYVGYFGGAGGYGYGGGIYVSSGTVSLSHCTLSNNRAAGGNAGGNGGNGNDGYGGGLCVLGGTVNLTNTTVSNNVAAGGSGGVGGYDGPGRGGGLYFESGNLTLTTVIVDSNLAESHSGVAEGGGMYVDSGTVSLSNDTVEFNTAQGGNWGEGGGIYLYLYTGTACLDAVTVAQVINNTASTDSPNISGRYSIC
jgi:hypothetical protein